MVQNFTSLATDLEKEANDLHFASGKAQVNLI